MASFTVNNPPSNLKMPDIQGVMNQYGGLAKSCRFAVRITAGGGSALAQSGYASFMQDLTYLCEAAEMPGRQFNNVDLRYYGPSFKLPYQTVYDDINMTFLCRTDSYERQLFDDWMELINPQNTYDFNYRKEYYSTITVYQLADYGTSARASQPTATYAWTLVDAYPILINPQPVTWADDQFQRLGVTFTYSKWTRLNRDPQPGTSGTLVGGSYNMGVKPK